MSQPETSINKSSENLIGTRERVDPIELLIQVRLLDATYRLFYLIAIVQVLIGLFFVVLNWSLGNHERLVIWYLSLSAASLPLIAKRHSYFREKIDSVRKVRAWTFPILLHAFFIGAAWGWAAIWFVDFFYLEHGIVNLMIILGMSFGAGIVIKTSPARAYVYMIPAITGIVYALFQVDEKVGMYGTAVAGIFAYIILAFMHADYREIVNNIRLSIEVSRLHERSLKDLEARTRLMTAVGHDLRQPLAVMNVLLATLTSKVSDDDARSTLGKMGVSVKSIDSMLTSLLSAAKLEAGVGPVNAPVPLLPLCERLRDEVRTVTEDQSNQLILECSEVVIDTDEKMLESILRNLLTNAAKYTRNGMISVTGRWTKEFFTLAVRDNGQGIDPEKQKRVFEEFTQLGNNDKSYLKGFGLGLSIASRTASVLGFRLDLESEPGKGSCFSLKIPADQISKVVPDIGQGEVLSTTENKKINQVAVVSADAQMQENLENLLTRWNYEVVLISYPQESQQVAENFSPDLIILVDLPELESRQYAPGNPDVPVISISETIDRGDASTNWLAKPVKPAKLRALIRNLLAQV